MNPENLVVRQHKLRNVLDQLRIGLLAKERRDRLPAISTPEYRINTRHGRPTIPSILIWKKYPAHSREVPRKKRSRHSGCPRKSPAAWWSGCVLPRERNKTGHPELHTDESRSTTKVAMENSTASGWMIFWIEDFAKSNPMIRIKAATTRPERYSYRACPYGCSASAGCCAILNPRSVTTEEDASDKLLTASAMMDTEFASQPTRSLPGEQQKITRRCLSSRQFADGGMHRQPILYFYNLSQTTEEKNFVIIIIPVFFLIFIYTKREKICQ